MRDVPTVDVSGIGLTSKPTQQAMELARLHGPVFRRRFHDRATLFVADLDLVTELADERRFAKSVGPALNYVREFAGDGLFTAYNEEPNWAKAHDILMPAFGLGSIRTYHPVMLQVARRLIESWDRRAATGTPVDVPGDMTRMTLDTIGLAGFGFDFGSFGQDEMHPFVDAMVRCLAWSMGKVSAAPGTGDAERDATFRADADYLASVVDEVIAARTAAGDTSTDDLLGLMLGAEHPADGTTLSVENIRDQIITFLIAGHETTSSTLSFALYFLAKNPTALRLVQREVDELWGDGEPEPAFEDIGRLTYTRQVLNEALRLWPAAPSFGRQAREDTLLGGRIPMRAGEIAQVLIPMLHRAPAWGDNPELFDPARFTAEAEAARSPHAFKPFGTGERACIGRQFALHEATMLIAMLVHRYRLIDHSDYRLDVKETLTLKPEGFTLAVAPRSTEDRAATRAALPATGSADTSDELTADDGLPARVLPGTRMLLLHGSNYGTCRDFAARLADEAAGIGCETEVAPLDDYAGALPTDRTVVIVAASYNGQPTDDAGKFVHWLENAAPGAADGVTFAVLGVGDRNWAATYQRVPTGIDARLAELGGTRLLQRTEGDASGDLTGMVRKFTATLGTTMLQRHGDPATVGAVREESGYTVTEVTGDPLDALAGRHGMVPMRITESGTLTDPAYPRVKRFLRVELPEGTDYRTADHLTVLPVNDPVLVERAAKVLGADPDAVLNIAPSRPGRDTLPIDRPIAVRDLLARHVELQDRPTAEQLGQLAELNPCPPEQAALRALAAGGGDERTLLDVIEDNPALREVLTWPVLLGLLPAMRPRQYSISSSPANDPRHVDLMVSLLRAPARSGRGTFRGTGSGYLNDVQAGETILARVQPCREVFRIDPTSGNPAIMISAGTGLAPFRGAIADRNAIAGEGELAPALCYFGCDAPDADYLHETELAAAEQAGAIVMRPVFSEQPRGGHRFVQHRITAESDEVWKLLDAGAKVYVCGDGNHMAPGVREAFRALYRERTGADEDAANAWLQGLVAEERYIEDVYAG